MNNLTTRKIVLGLLMTLVLAFSVQGVAEAVQRPAEPSDLNPTTVYNVGDPATIASIALTFDDDARRESVSISKSSGITFTGDFFGFTGGSLTENDSNGADNNAGNRYAYTADGRQRFTTGTSISIGINFTTKGKHTVRISSTDYDDGVGNDEFRGSWSYTYTYYVKGSGTSTTTVSLRGLSNGYRQNLFTGTQIEVHSGDSGHYDVEYTTVPSGGTFQIEGTTGTLGSYTEGSGASSVFDLLLTMSRSYQVTADVTGSNITTTGAYIIGSPNLTVGFPDNPDGIGGAAVSGSKTTPGFINQVLSRAFRARVTDGTVTSIPADVNGGETGSVPGVVVKFQVSGSGTASGYLVFNSGRSTDPNAGTLVEPNNRERLDANGLQLTTATAKVLYIRTNASGQANVDFQLGTDRKQNVTISAVRQTKTVSAYTGTALSGNQLVDPSSRSSQARGHAGEFELRVKVEDEDGTGLSGQSVQFRTSDGTLDDPATAALPTTVGHLIVATDTRGEAFVFFDPNESSGSPRVTAHLLDVGTDTIPGTTDDTVIDDVVFNIGGSTGQPPPGLPPGTATLTVSPPDITGAPGSIETLTINAGAPNVFVLILGSDEFNNASGSNIEQPQPTNAAGVTTASITLPTAAGSYDDLSVVAQGYPSVPVPVTVTSAAGLTASPAIISGAPGSQQRILATARNAADDPVPNLPVTFTIVDVARITQSAGIQNTGVSGIAAWTFTLPTTPGSYTLNIAATGYESTTASLSVVGVAPATGIRLLVSDGNNQTGEPGTRLSDPLVVTVVDSRRQGVDGQLVQFSVTGGGGRVSPANATTNASGQAQTRLTLGRTAGTNTVRATLNGVSVTFTATAEAAPAFLDIYDGNNQRGTLNDELADPLVVQVLDSNENGVANVRVDFRVTSGSARLSQRGTGNAARVFTDRNGMAGAPITPTGTAPITVRATSSGLVPVEFTITTGPPPASLTKVSGDNQAGTPGNALANPLVVEVQDEDGDAVDGVMVTFEVTEGGGTLSDETATTNANGRAQTSLTLGSERGINSVRASVTGLDPVTFNTSIDPVILVAASNRPVMYWIDGGALYYLAGAKAKQIAPSANDVAVDTAGGKIYWAVQTGERAGMINSANLDGTNVETVKETPYNVPLSLAVDSANGKLYWIDSRDRIRSSNLDGTGGQELLSNLPEPKDIALSNGNAYWTEGTGSIRRVNLTGRKTTVEIASGLGSIGGIAISGNKVYWTEDAGDGTGGIYRANLDGNNVETVKDSPYNAPLSLAVDSADEKLYWTEAKGRIRSSNLNGGKVRGVVEGLISPGRLAIGGENSDTPSQPQTPQRPTTAKSKYDVNNDGTVDNADAALVSGAMGTSTAAYDVNGDGTVDFLDVLLVFDNRDEAAGAPTVARTRLTAVQVDRIQEQIDLLLATNDRSPVALYTLQYLQSLIAAARPGKTQLLANYPNPFNPETWIPYELATDTNVKLTIYDTQGIVVRTLELGHQSAGYYTGRDRAAYWDGRNSSGELVASGLYFYQLETDQTSSMRKMVILK